MKNLHVVFTMNPSQDGLKDRAATSPGLFTFMFSLFVNIICLHYFCLHFPALFNRCVLNWFGDWSNSALFQVAKEFTIKVDLERTDWSAPDFFPVAVPSKYF